MSADGRRFPASRSGRRSSWPWQCLMRLDRGEGLLEGPPAQHARSALVRQDRLAQLAVRGGGAGLRRDGPGAGRRALRRRMPRYRPRAAAATSTAELFNGEYYIQIPDREPTSRPSARTTAARSTRCSGRAGPIRSGLGRILDEAQRQGGPGRAVEVQLHARRRPVPQALPGRPLVRHGRRRRTADVFLAQGRQGPRAPRASTTTSTSA